MNLRDIFRSNFFLNFLPTYNATKNAEKRSKLKRHSARHRTKIFNENTSRLEYPFAISYHPDRILSSEFSFEDLQKNFNNFRERNEENNGGDISRFYSFILNLEQIMKEGIQGDFAELGVYKGNTAAILAQYAHKMKRRLFLLDTFEGFSAEDIQEEKHKGLFSDTNLEDVKQLVQHEQTCTYLKGYFPDTITDELQSRRFCFVSLDCDLYKPTKAGLEFFYPRIEKGGYLFIHDYSSPAWITECAQAVDEFCCENGTHVTILPDKSGTAVLRK